MANLNTSYMGLELKSPIIVGSSGLTNSIENIIKAADNGAGAVVLKSLFEEQIRLEINKKYHQDNYAYPEAEDYIKHYAKGFEINRYIEFIKEAKEKVDIPIIASINCVSSGDWVDFAKKIEEAGADALELNIFILPSDVNVEGAETEKIYFDIIEAIHTSCSLPLAIKLSPHFSGLANFIRKLSWSNTQAVLMFNRFYSPDIDINKMTVHSANTFSSPEESFTVLRWVALIAEEVECNISATTGIHTSEAVIKQLLAGADTVQLASILYKKGLEYIHTINDEILDWMENNKFDNIIDFRGKMNAKQLGESKAFNRVQFMKHFSEIE